MSYEPSKVPSVQEFYIVSKRDITGAIMVCQGCEEEIWIHSLAHAVAQADLHEQEKHLVDLFELPAEISQAV